MENNNQNQQDNNKPKKPVRPGGLGNTNPNQPFNVYWIYAILSMGLIGMLFFGQNKTIKKVDWSDFQEYVNDNRIESIVVYSNKDIAEAKVRSESVNYVFGEEAGRFGANPFIQVNIPSTQGTSEFLDTVKKEKAYDIKVRFDTTSEIWGMLLTFAPFLLIIVFWIWMMRRMQGGPGGGGGGIFSVGKSKAQLFDKDAGPKVTFKDVAGLSEAKEEVQEIVEFLKHPGNYTNLGGKIPKGALLVGPPGTGKTLLAKAVAGEANVPFFSISGSDFVEMFVGVGASRVRDLFRQAKEKSPCIVFIDEIDAVGRARGKNVNFGSNDERENTLNQLLTEMDGFGSNSGVIILAATNRVDILDKALLRAGRFDRQIYVELPDLNDRKEIFKVHLRPIKIDESVDVEFLARQTPGFSGADIANVCNEAALIAARNKKKFVEREDFISAVDRIIGGLEKKNKIITQDEKKSIAIHEAGHATLSWFLEHANPLVKVTIVPRGKALGAAWYLPEERQITTKDQMLDEICALLGGRAAEEIFIGKISSGAMNDLERVTKQAYGMITYLGMSDKMPNLSYYDSSGQDYTFQKPFSENTAELIDAEVKVMIAEQYERAKEMLLKHADGHHQLAQILLEKEIIYAENLEQIFGKRPWISRSQEILQSEDKSKNVNDDLSLPPIPTA
ncbi:MAG: ATP-dependent zinc metalloprotease FtsH [Petrimonas sp.]|jgi:cell division protease FtsH|uniref:ATP-dependent zinc metalloprotease FtsH n=1 Tax=Petrimonas sulfuriphila TaxID=285070 RepID=UPI000E900AB3|nr:ATP-dependent zinc metalloprotease FtsH [Petrimonas sp.]NLU30245.1 ATP-dependent zinc metalloprotease FtsH [Bacteroidales bacterium]HAC73802.1 cell division protein FtsH [Porphyromonadaceae bacterium]MDD4014794.1 ATP-dependent zinc metalloprotease FtsH [Petrimonas sp.]MDD4535930.1 ATP-dependent zinc metalloprotease FtsH [Petrimonas sp.]